MSVFTDQRGIAYTAASQDAVDCFDTTMDEYTHFGTGTGERLKKTLAADPEFPMAHVLRGCFMQLFCVPALTEKAKQSLAKAREAAVDRGVDEREGHHMEALDAWIAGDLRGAVGHWESILLRPTPRYACRESCPSSCIFTSATAAVCATPSLAFCTHGNPTYRVTPMCSACTRSVLEESGDYRSAEDAGRLAAEKDPADPWSVHAVAHVLEMQDRRHDGIAWLRGLESHWNASNNFRFHLWWHLALCHLELEQYEEVLHLYDNGVSPRALRGVSRYLQRHIHVVEAR